jgi:hypothetical protein
MFQRTIDVQVHIMLYDDSGGGLDTYLYYFSIYNNNLFVVYVTAEA